MDVEHTMEFIRDQHAKNELQQAKNQELLAKMLAARQAREVERRQRVRPRIDANSDVRAQQEAQRLAQHEANFQRIEKNLAEATEGLKRLARKLA
jgi:cell fate (sporulation/competence/biofilm development) regulator YmcA (YheA/YmcA/DUF963 family)